MLYTLDRFFPTVGTLNNAANSALLGVFHFDLVYNPYNLEMFGFSEDGTVAISGSSFSETLAGSTDSDFFRLTDNDGSDTLIGGGGTDTVSYATSAPTGDISFDLQTGLVTQGSQTDQLIDIDRLIATDSAHDVLDGSADTNGFTANLDTGEVSGTDSHLHRAINFEKVLGGSGNDTLLGSDANNTLRGGAGNDTLNGGAGIDLLDGGDGNDHFIGSSGDDLILGGNGDDVILARDNDGNDIYRGGAGTDTVNYSNELHLTYHVHSDLALESFGTQDQLTDIEVVIAPTGSVIDCAGETANLTLDLSTDTFTGLTSHVTSFIGFSKVVGGTGADTIIGDIGDNSLNGAAGSDTLDGGAGNDTLIGGSGADHLLSSSGNDRLDGGADDDIFIYTDNFGHDTIQNGSGNDTLDMSQVTANLIFDLAAGNVDAGGDSIHFSGVETLMGGIGDDSFNFNDGFLNSNFGTLVLDGTGGNNTLDFSNVSVLVTHDAVNHTITAPGGVIDYSNIQQFVNV